jgi:hypothetical protein
MSVRGDEGRRLEARKDMRALVIISLDLQRRVYTRIHRKEGLPHDCFQLASLPKPTGTRRACV